MLPPKNGFRPGGAVSDLCQVLGPVEINGRALRVGRRERNTGEPKSTPNDVEHAGADGQSFWHAA